MAKAENKQKDSYDDEFDKLLENFINEELKDVSVEKPSKAPPKKNKPQKDEHVEADNESFSLASEENNFFHAYNNFTSACNDLAQEFSHQPIVFRLTKDNLYPRFKPKLTNIILDDTVKGWEL